MLFKNLIILVTILCCCKLNGIYSMGRIYTSESYNQYYIEFEEKFNWFESQTACLKMNMTLVEIETNIKSNEITKLIEDAHKEENLKNVTLWIGGIMTRYPKVHFVWLSTGQPFTYTNWYANNPNFYGKNEFCVQIVMERNLKWNDNTCLNKFGYVCELNQTLQWQEKYKQLQQQLQNVKEKLQQENQTHQQIEQNLKQQVQLKQEQLQMEIEKSENLDENLQIEITKRENLQQELRRLKDMQEYLEELLQPFKEKQKKLEFDKEEELRDRRILQHDIKDRQALNLQLQKKLQQLKENLQKMPEKYDEYIRKEVEEQRKLQQKLKTALQLQQQFREQLIELKEKF